MTTGFTTCKNCSALCEASEGPCGEYCPSWCKNCSGDTMKYVRQPPKSKVCGQACVAMAAGYDLQGGIDLVGHAHGTWGTDLRRGLDKAGISHSQRMIRGEPPVDANAILFFKHPSGRRRHWVLWHNGKYYDPHAGVFRELPNWLKHSRLTSHLLFTLP